MSILEMKANGSYLYFDALQCIEAGKARAIEYQSAMPFPHIVMEDFLDPAVLRGIIEDFPDKVGHPSFERPQERFKYQFSPHICESARIRNLLAELNAAPFLGFLEAMTGISGLIPDPHFDGGGLHETLSGGHLSIHADFNIHVRLNLERRLNLLIYLNDDWLPEYGGALELWDKSMRTSARNVLPMLGHAVVFSTDRHSFHGQPNPLTCPPDRSRRSIATYYYTALEKADNTIKRNTAFQTRLGTTDRPDTRVRIDHFLADWMPPRLLPAARRMARTIIRNLTGE